MPLNSLSVDVCHTPISFLAKEAKPKLLKFPDSQVKVMTVEVSSFAVAISVFVDACTFFDFLLFLPGGS